MTPPDWRRHLPSVDRLKGHAALDGLQGPDTVRTLCARAALEEVRTAIAAGSIGSATALAAAVAAALERARRVADGPSLRRVLNGTGVLLHTNAGRAPLPAAAVAAIADTARGYCNLELDLASGRRGSRQAHLGTLLRWLTGAEAALVVNNGAAAVLLALHALCRGRPVVVSRGELVEIGGGFRVPDILAAAGVELVEVGTTNRTHAADYAEAIDLARANGRPVAGLLQVHRSNFALIGFVHTPALAELAALARAAGVPLVVDLGAGALAVEAALATGGPGRGGAAREPTVQEVLAAGADLVCMSGDKLIGGPQAGIVVGARRWVERLQAEPLARAVRIDNLVVAALEAVLRMHLLGHTAQIPALAQLQAPAADVGAYAVALAAALRAALGPAWTVEVEPALAEPGGGTDPLVELPSFCLAVARDGVRAEATALAALAAPVPLLGRVRGDRLLLDVRSLRAGSHGAPPAGLAAELAAALWTEAAA